MRHTSDSRNRIPSQTSRSTMKQSILSRKRNVVSIIIAVLAVVVSYCSPSVLRATVPSPSHAPLVRSSDSIYKVMFIGHLNTDCYDDTVLAVVSKTPKVDWRREMILPRYIVWGVRTDTTIPQCSDTVGGTIADSLRYSYSILQYPSFVGLRGSLSYMQLNPTDTEYDLVCFLWGKTDTSTTQRDTSTTFAVFGRKGFDTLRIIPLHTIDTTQQTPLRAMQLKRPKHFLQPGRRDFSLRNSYQIPSMGIVVVVDTSGHHDSVVIQEVASSVHPDQTLVPEFKVYPNPAVNLTTIVGKHVPSGRYHLRLLTESGQGVWEKEVVSLSGEDILFSMDVTPLSTGYYHLQITRTGTSIGTFPIVIIH